MCVCVCVFSFFDFFVLLILLTDIRFLMLSVNELPPLIRLMEEEEVFSFCMFRWSFLGFQRRLGVEA